MSAEFTINKVYPWGRRFHEYDRMFELGSNCATKSILDCGGGSSSFNAEATARGWNVTTIDPLYQFSAEEIRRRVEDTREEILAMVRAEYDRFSWKTISSPDAMGEARIDAMGQFLEDYDAGLAAGRYLNESLPALPFSTNQFNLALVSHLLFLNQSLDLNFHIESLTELLRVATEVRVFPLLDMNGENSEYLLPVWKHFTELGHTISLQPVDYQVQKGGAIMLRLAWGPG